MDSKKRDRETALEHEEHVNPPKKKKSDSLLLEVEKKNIVGLRNLVNNGADVRSADHFSLNNLDFEEFHAIFAAIISDQESVIDFFAGKNPHFTVEDIKNLSVKLNEEQLTELIDVLELVGAACIYYGDSEARKHGWNCWDLAMELRKVNAMPKQRLHLSELGRLALRNKSEIMDSTELEALSERKPLHWKTQAFFVSHRILTKYDCFPNSFVVFNLYHFGLNEWGKRKLNRSRLFLISLYLVELFDMPSFVNLTLKDKPEESFEVIKLTLVQLHKLLQDRKWTLETLKEKDTLLTYDNLMTALCFSCNHELKVHDSWPSDSSSKEKYVKLISDLIHVILKLLVQIPRTDDESMGLTQVLSPLVQGDFMNKSCKIFVADSSDENALVIELLLQAGFHLKSSCLGVLHGIIITTSLMKIFEESVLIEQVLDLPTNSWISTVSTLEFLIEILEDALLLPLQKRRQLFTFEFLMYILEFLQKYLLKNSTMHPREVEGNLTTSVLNLLTFLPLTTSERHRLKNILTSLRKFGDLHNLLQKVCSPLANEKVNIKIVELLIYSGFNLEDCVLSRPERFSIVIQLVRIFQPSVPMNERLLEIPTDCWDGVLSVIIYLKKTLNQDTDFASYENLYHLLIFVCNTILKLNFGYHPFKFMVWSSSPWPIDESKRYHYMDQAIGTLLAILNIATPQTKSDRRGLNNLVATFINLYEHNINDRKPSLLIKACEITPVNYKVIKLLLRAGANTNCVDQQRHGPLYLLANKELAMIQLWNKPSYMERAKNFTKIVREILHEGYHSDQHGIAALEGIRRSYLYYPVVEFRELLKNNSRRVLPLSCLAAKQVKSHKLPCNDLPVTLQSLVLQH